MADAKVRITKRLVDGLEADGTTRYIRETDVLGLTSPMSCAIGSPAANGSTR